jgi:hypothetical protein
MCPYCATITGRKKQEEFLTLDEKTIVTAQADIGDAVEEFVELEKEDKH